MPAMTRAPASLTAKPRISVDDCQSRLAAMQRDFRARWIGLLALGAIVCMIGPVVIGSAIWAKQFGRRRGVVLGHAAHSWVACVGMTALWFLPILFVIEWLTRGKLLESVTDAAQDSYHPLFAGRALGGAFFVEVCLWGPRMVIGGTRRILDQSKHAGADRLLCAKIVHALAIRGEGAATAELFRHADGRDIAFGDALGCLMFYDVIGISKNGDRAWLLSEAKKTLHLDAR
jgi:hypothetical protein